MNGASSTAQQSKGPADGGRPLCRYFASNICYKGDACEFSHDRNAKPDLTCRYYLAGNCAYGSRCRYDHVRRQSSHETTCFSPPSGTQKAHVSPTNSNNNNIARTPNKNPWNMNPLNNFHQGMAQELELISSGLESPPGTSSSAALMNRIANGDEKALADLPLCPYFEMGLCIEGDMCKLLHGLQCDMCGLNTLHPYDQAQRLTHHRECLAEHEKQMEAAFAEARSADKQCGVCMEQIMEKGLRFGILQNCAHCYCLDCIRKWRRHNDDQIKTKTVRACPECRVHSDYVIPSKFWIEDKADKEKLVEHFKGNTKKIPCKYVVKGEVDKCPFGNKCFYKHQMPDGTIVEGKSPSELRDKRRHHRSFNLVDFLLDIWVSDDDYDDLEELYR